MTHRRHPALPPATLEDDDLLRKIFLLLPPQPSAFPRLSLVCKQWRGVVTDPQFLRGFRDHHKKPPLLGLVMGYTGSPYFRSDLDPPYHIPHERFFPPTILDLHMNLFDCRHGRVLFYDHARYEIFVWDPATRDRHCAVVPPLFDEKEVGAYNGAVLCAARDEGHVHGDCHSSPFQVVLMGISGDYKRAYASVYSSETGMWSDIISITNRPMYDLRCPSTLVGNAIYWTFDGDEVGILEYDLGRQSLANIEMPPDLEYYSHLSLRVLLADDGCIGLAMLSYYRFELWERKVSCDGIAGWVLQKPVKLNTILGLGPMGEFRNLGKENFTTTSYHPYRSFYTAVSDLAVCERRTGGISAPVAKENTCMAAASWSVGTVEGTSGKSKNIDQGMDANLVPSRVLTQTRIDVIFKKEMETRSKLSKAWAKWFRSNGVPGNKADCPHFRNALKLTHQLGTRFVVPTGDEIDHANLEASDDELP
ncbi:uncharacterized protein LOC124672769 [Lolium rigidum]|uniref:uncharacterized protein LOC124672769 n=1 Tax=Lolium rigidum TaxID=89674 RepID=UPI001F5E07AA|nr:uncharacterized protein LOC124672769 [Lolium rigidum]